MATGITPYFAERFVLPQFRGEGVVAPDFYTLRLTSDIPQADGTATPLTAGTAPGYADLVIDAVPAEWEFINSRHIASKLIKLYPKATTGSWPSVQGWQLLEAATTNILFFGHATSGRIIDSTQRFKILPQGLQIKISDVQKFATDAFCSRILGLLQGTNIPAITDFDIDFGTKDPTTDGDIGKLVGSGYAPLNILANATEMGVPAARTIANLVEFDHTRMFTTTKDVEQIISAELSVAGTPCIRGILSTPISLKANDNPRIEVGSLRVIA